MGHETGTSAACGGASAGQPAVAGPAARRACGLLLMGTWALANGGS